MHEKKWRDGRGGGATIKEIGLERKRKVKL